MKSIIFIKIYKNEKTLKVWTVNALPQKIVTREAPGFRLPVFDVGLKLNRNVDLTTLT